MLLNCGVGEESWESLRLEGDPTSPFERKSVLKIHWKDWCWSWNSNTLAAWCEELTPWKRSWCWERLKAGGEGDDRRWDGWMAAPTQWTWVWVNSGSWRWIGSPAIRQSMGSQKVGHDWATELNWILGSLKFFLKSVSWLGKFIQSSECFILLFTIMNFPQGMLCVTAKGCYMTLSITGWWETFCSFVYTLLYFNLL